MTDTQPIPMPEWLRPALEQALADAIVAGAMPRDDAWRFLANVVRDYAVTADGHGRLGPALGELWFRAGVEYVTALRCDGHRTAPAGLLLLDPDGHPVDENALDDVARAEVAAARFLTLAMAGDRPGMTGLFLGTCSRGLPDTLTTTVALLVIVGHRKIVHAVAHGFTIPAAAQASLDQRIAEETPSATAAARIVTAASGATAVKL